MEDEKVEESPKKKLPMVVRFAEGVLTALDTPATWFRKNIVESNRQPYPYYHMKYQRVPTIDECYYGDILCSFEADQQVSRDKQVDSKIVGILHNRYKFCTHEEAPDHKEKCAQLQDDWNNAANNWFIKYGDLGARATAQRVFMKQKHRLVWERRQKAKEAEAEAVQ